MPVPAVRAHAASADAQPVAGGPVRRAIRRSRPPKARSVLGRTCAQRHLGAVEARCCTRQVRTRCCARRAVLFSRTVQQLDVPQHHVRNLTATAAGSRLHGPPGPRRAPVLAARAAQHARSPGASSSLFHATSGVGRRRRRATHRSSCVRRPRRCGCCAGGAARQRGAHTRSECNSARSGSARDTPRAGP